MENNESLSEDLYDQGSSHHMEDLESQSQKHINDEAESKASTEAAKKPLEFFGGLMQDLNNT